MEIFYDFIVSRINLSLFIFNCLNTFSIVFR